MKYDPTGDTELQLTRILNGGVEFGDNIKGSFIEFETTGEEQEVEHNLGVPPSGWLKIFQDAEVELWATRQGDWTKDVMFLQSNVKKVTVRLFVL